MFGSVTSGTIADQLKTQFDVALDKRKIHLEQPIRTLGEHEVELRLHQDVVTTLKVRVESSTPLPQLDEAEAAVAEKAAAEQHPRTEKRGRRPERAQAAAEPAAEKAVKAEKAEKPERKPRETKPKTHAKKAE